MREGRHKVGPAVKREGKGERGRGSNPPKNLQKEVQVLVSVGGVWRFWD